MSQTITVRGIGKASAKPDHVVLSMTLEAQNKNYEEATEEAADQLEKIRNSLASVGFEKESLKTSQFNVRTDYKHVQDEGGGYRQEFVGYVVSHSLKLAFDLEPELLSQALSQVTASLANPQIAIAFTVKDPTAINEELLRSATNNARRKAEVLCEASGVKLGQLHSINYNWEEMRLFSNTRYDIAEESMSMMAKSAPIDLEPEDIEVSDTAAFVWTIQPQ